MALQPVVGLTFSPDGQTLVSGGRDNVVRFWSTKSWQETMALSRFDENIQPDYLSVVFNGDGTQMLMGGASGRLIIWRAQPKD